MNDETIYLTWKEILEMLKALIKNGKSINIVAGYISNLQDENKKLKANQPVRCSEECKHFNKTVDGYPCNMCSSCYTNKFKRKESE